MTSERDLRQALQKAGERLEAPAGEPAIAMARARGRRAARYSVTAAAVLLALVAVPVVTRLVQPPEKVILDSGPVDRALIVYRPGEGGLEIMTGTGRERIWDDAVRSAFSDHAGGVVFQVLRTARPFGLEAGDILWLAADGSLRTVLAMPSAESDPTLAHITLLGVATLDGETHAAFTRRGGSTPDDMVEHLVVVPLTGEAERVIGETAGWHSGAGSLAHAPGLFAYTVCGESHCSLSLMDENGQPADAPRIGESAAVGAVALSSDARLVSYVTFDPWAAQGDDRETMLHVHDLADGRLVESVPLEGIPESVDVDAQGRVLVSVRVPDNVWRVFEHDPRTGETRVIDVDGIARYR